MAITRSTASRVRRGRVGDTTYYTAQGREIARAALNSSNYGASASRTTAQQSRRVRWSNLVNFYKVSKPWMAKAFETKKSGVSDYNMLMKINVNGSNVALTKAQAASGACVVESYQVSQGSLMPIEAVKRGEVWETNIKVGELVISAATTIGQFSQAVIAANSWLTENMQISFISYQQTIDGNNVPRVICTPYEVTLNVNSTELLRYYLPDFCTAVADGFLATTEAISPGAFTYVLSNSVSGKTYVSSQTLINNNADTIALFSSDEQITEAIASYGQDGDVFLDSGSQPTDATTQPSALIGGIFGGVAFNPAAKSVTRNDVEEKSARLLFGMDINNVETLVLHFVGANDKPYSTSTTFGATPTMAANQWICSRIEIEEEGNPQDALYRIEVVANGQKMSYGYEKAPEWGWTQGE